MRCLLRRAQDGTAKLLAACVVVTALCSGLGCGGAGTVPAGGGGDPDPADAFAPEDGPALDAVGGTDDGRDGAQGSEGGGADDGGGGGDGGPDDGGGDAAALPLLIDIKTQVGVSEVVELQVDSAGEDRYPATFAGIGVTLYRTSPTTLALVVPDVPGGSYQFVLGEESRWVDVIAVEVPPAPQAIATAFQSIDTELQGLGGTTPEALAEIEEVRAYGSAVRDLLDSLSEEQKQQAIHFAQANQEAFDAFSRAVEANLDVRIMIARASECPRSNWKEYYTCATRSLALSLEAFNGTLAEFGRMAGYVAAVAGTGLSLSALGPAAWGLIAVGSALPLGAGVYLLVARVRPAWVKLRRDLVAVLETPWIFRKELFAAIKSQFSSAALEDLALQPEFRTLEATDGALDPAVESLVSALETLQAAWSSVAALFGTPPGYQPDTQPTTLATDEVIISNISNPNVELVEQSGQRVRFKATSNRDETFTYLVTVTKQGFTERHTAVGTLKHIPLDCNGDPDGTATRDECGACVGGLTGKTACQYTMELLTGYTPDYSGFTAERTVNNGDALTVYNMTYRHARLLLDGRPVKVGQYALAADRVYFTAAIGSTDVRVNPFTITLSDAENYRTIKRTVDLTISNAGFRAISGATLTYGNNLVTLTYNADFTGTRRLGGEYPSAFTWEMTVTGDEEYVDCPGGPMKYKVMGAVSAPVGYGQSPSYAMILDGGGFKGNSSYGCPDQPQLR